MFLSEFTNDLRKIFNHYGSNNQLEKLKEEVGEVATAVEEYEKNGEAKTQDATFFVACELTDVFILLEQFRLKYHIPYEDIETIARFKILRQFYRMAAESYQEEEL